MESSLVAIARAALGPRHCLETSGDTPGSVSFTYPTEYVEGMEYCAALTVCPSTGTHGVIYKYDKLMGEFSLGNGANRSEKIENLLSAVKKFQGYCEQCDEDLHFTRVLCSRGGMMARFSPSNLA